MQIIILGDNDVAKGLTETLSREEHDVTLVGRVCRDARERFTPSLVQIDSHCATAN